MFDAFLLRAALSAAGIAVAAAPLGCFVIWRRMAYFGDATAHAAVLGVALALGFSLWIPLGVLMTSLAMGLGIAAFAGEGQGTDREGRALPAADALLGVFSHGALACGLVATTLVPGRQADLYGFLFGDILAVGTAEVVIIWCGAVGLVGVMAWRWNRLITATLHPDLARAADISPGRERLVLTAALAVLVALAIKIVGALLITAMLIIPAAAARPLAKSPEAMAFITAGLGVLAGVGGLWAAFHFDTPAGPTIVATAVVIFIASQSGSRLLWRFSQIDSG